jgi:hypothetical protein
MTVVCGPFPRQLKKTLSWVFCEKYSPQRQRGKAANQLRNDLPQRRKDAKEKKSNVPNVAPWRLGGKNSESESPISEKLAQAAKTLNQSSTEFAWFDKLTTSGILHSRAS